MKKLTPKQIEKMTLGKAWEIAREFCNFIANREIPLSIDYESNLPYSKGDILLALVVILKDEKPEFLRKKRKGKIEIKELVASMILTLENYIPTENEYQEKVKMRADDLEEFSKEENIKMWKKTREEWRGTL